MAQAQSGITKVTMEFIELLAMSAVRIAAVNEWLGTNERGGERERTNLTHILQEASCRRRKQENLGEEAENLRMSCKGPQVGREESNVDIGEGLGKRELPLFDIH
jgi:hypothetical protein